MKLYHAGIYASNFEKSNRIYQIQLTDTEKSQRDMVENILESYHYVHRQSYVDKMRKEGARVFLDSGAFSAFTKGVEIDIQRYCQYIKTNIDIIEHVDGVTVASVLDGIGDPLKTFQNQKRMEQLGATPLPCFHYGEDERYLEYYVANYPYITLGGMVPISTPQLKIWLDRIWERYLTDGAGRARVKVHGFGLTTPSLMLRYPWYSVDSSSWVRVAWAGGVMFPTGRVLSISTQNPSRKTENQHLDSLPMIQREAAVKELTRLGLDVERARQTQYPRWAFNAAMFIFLARNCTQADPKFVPDQQGLF